MLSTGLIAGASAYGVHELMGAVGSTYTAFDNGRINGQDSTQFDSQTGDGDSKTSELPDGSPKNRP